MRILYHHRTLGDGAEGVHIHSMIEAFRALGHEVLVESLARPQGSGRGHAGPLSTLRQKLPQSVFEAGALTANLVEYRATRRHIRQSSPAMLYKRHALFDVGAVTAATRAGVPVVLEVNRLYSATAMGEFEPLALERLARQIERHVIRTATVVAAVSTPLRQQIEELAGPAVNVLVVPNGADFELFDPARVSGEEVRRRYGLGDAFTVGWVGVLRAWHGLDVLVRAIAQVSGAKLLIVGDGPARGELEALAASLGVAERVRITGRIDHHEVPAHIAALDVAVSPDDRTGFASPMKVIEYMAMGRAVVVPRLPNMLDIIDDGVSGLTFTHADHADMARLFSELQACPDLRRRIGEGARHAVVHRLNWKENARTVLAAVATARPWQVSEPCECAVPGRD